MSIKSMMQQVELWAAYECLSKDPEINLPRLLELTQRLDRDGVAASWLAALRPIAQDPGSNWNRLLKSLWTEVDDGQRQALFTNLAVNAGLQSASRRRELGEEYGCRIPWALVIDPTSDCGRRCPGCAASGYGLRQNLAFEELDGIVEQGKELGIYFYAFSGGEPLLRRQEIIALCNKHRDCEFLIFTGGGLIDESFAEDMLRVRNLVPTVALDGGREQTDALRGPGAYEEARRAMRLLQEKKLLFGTVCCCTPQNSDTVSSEEYLDTLLGLGAKFAWYSLYLPLGACAEPARMLSAAARERLSRRLETMRHIKPLLTMDGCGLNTFFGGCPAGRGYVHVSAGGDVEPCAFVHYSDSNIRQKSLLECLQSSFFLRLAGAGTL